MAQIFRPSTIRLARASTVCGALNPNALDVARFSLARSSMLPSTDCLSRLSDGVSRHSLTATKDKLAEVERMQSIVIHHTYSRGGKAAEHAP
jgi:hypothetical protein